MSRLLRKCPSCSTYTFQDTCPKCSTKTVSPHPPKFSPDDKYARLRIVQRYRSEKTENNI
ncbi:MAG: RNA-protein complex protein Nop10 [Thaumarchaeota archaeon]|nr:RNA-protein complex protein Nop10 [Nitrososphaerota archaeon]